jgi:hypothetical protein
MVFSGHKCDCNAQLGNPWRGNSSSVFVDYTLKDTGKVGGFLTAFSLYSGIGVDIRCMVNGYSKDCIW